MKYYVLIGTVLLAATRAVAVGEGPDMSPTPGARYATDAFPGFERDDKVVNSEKKEPRWFKFWNGPKYETPSAQYEWCRELVAAEKWSRATTALDALVREWPSSDEAAKAQEALASIYLDYLDDTEQAFAEYKYLIDFYSLSCDYLKTVDKLYEVAGRMRLEGKTIVFFRFKNTVDVRRAYEACVLRAPGAKWAPQAMLTIAELREEDQDYAEAVKVYENLRNLHYGSLEARKGLMCECRVRMQLQHDYGYNRERTRDTLNFLKLAMRIADENDRPAVEQALIETQELLETEAWRSTKFYDSPTRTKRSAITAYEHFLSEYPEGEHAEEAKTRLEELKQ